MGLNDVATYSDASQACPIDSNSNVKQLPIEIAKHAQYIRRICKILDAQQRRSDMNSSSENIADSKADQSILIHVILSGRFQMSIGSGRQIAMSSVQGYSNSWSKLIPSEPGISSIH